MQSSSSVHCFSNAVSPIDHLFILSYNPDSENQSSEIDMLFF
jgi:hypothetical protein